MYDTQERVKEDSIDNGGFFPSSLSTSQWLFPIREHGLNSMAQPLQKHEAEAITNDPQMKARAIKSYQLMLDFYGMKMIDDAGVSMNESVTFFAYYVLVLTLNSSQAILLVQTTGNATTTT
jgi:hypothetical protein